MFVGRNPDGSIYGTWTMRQWDGQEELADDHPDLRTFRNRPSLEARRRARIETLLDGATSIDELRATLKQLLT